MTDNATIQQDVDINDSVELTRDDAAAQFLKKWEAADGADRAGKPANTDKGDTDAEDEETVQGQSENEEDESSDDADDEAEEGSEEEEEASAKEVLADDNHVIKFTFDGKEHSTTVKDLKRLAGQEASLTRKSQELATKRKEVDNSGAQYVTALGRLTQLAEADYAPYANVDFLAASRDMEPEEFEALRADAVAKYERLRFLKEETAGFIKAHEEKVAADLKARAIEAVKVLSDPDGGIEGWSPAMYKELTGYAVKEGLPEETVAKLVDPVVFKLLHKAMSYDKAKTVATKKKAKAPKKVLSSKIASGSFDKDKAKAALNKLKSTGSRNDAADALLAKWGVGEAD